MKKVLKKEQQESYETVRISFICKEKFENKYENNTKARDNCHCTGEYGGVAHSMCNLKYSVPKINPIVFHNASYL